jgi:hypothetical protein
MLQPLHLAGHLSEFKQGWRKSGNAVSSGNAVWRNGLVLVVIGDGLMA